MRRLLAAVLLSATMLAGCVGVPEKPLAGSAVRIELADGLGSGVYIGNGVIITAAHVVGDATKVKIVADNGKAQSGEVLWTNVKYDIAAVRPSKPARLTVATMTCRKPVLGEALRAVGNPAGVEFVTMHGYVSGLARELAPKWKSAFITDMTTIGGMSGGPVFADSGVVIGINVGVVGFGSPSGGMGFVVPSADVCALIGRS